MTCGKQKKKEELENITLKLIKKFHLSNIKYNQLKSCQFYENHDSSYSPECNRYLANLRNSRMIEKEHKRSSTSSYNKPASLKLPNPKHPGKFEASRYLRKMKQLFSSSEDEKNINPELFTLEKEEQKEIDALGRDTEDEATKVQKFKTMSWKKMKTT